jgi:hypothetical protein
MVAMTEADLLYGKILTYNLQNIKLGEFMCCRRENCSGIGHASAGDAERHIWVLAERPSHQMALYRHWSFNKVIVNGCDINLEQVKAGIAWDYKKYQRGAITADRMAYSASELEARRHKL